MLHQTITADPAVDRETAIDVLVASHRVALDLVPTLTDLPTTLTLAKQLRAKVEFFAKHRNLGMLGRNGIGPAVDSCLRSAQRAGFTWRAAA